MAREEQTAQTQDVSQFRGLRRRGIARVAFKLCDAGLDVSDERTRDRIRRWEGALAERRHRPVPDANPEERAFELALDLPRVEVESVRPDTGQARFEDEVRVGPGRELLDEIRLALEAGCVDVDPLEAGLADGPLVDRHRVLAGGLVEGHQQDLAGAILVDRHRLRGAGVGVGRRAGLALLRRVPVAEGEVVEPRRRDLLLGDDDLVVLRAFRDRDRAVNDADVPRGLRLAVRERAGWGRGGNWRRGWDADVPEWT